MYILLFTFESIIFWLDNFLNDCIDPFCCVLLDSAATFKRGIKFDLTVIIHGSSKSVFPESSLYQKKKKIKNLIELEIKCSRYNILIYNTIIYYIIVLTDNRVFYRKPKCKNKT